MIRRCPIRVLCLVIVACLAALTRGAAADPQVTPISLEDKLLISIPTDHLQPLTLKGEPARGGYAIRIAPDLSTAAYIARKDGKHFVVVGSEKGPDLEGEISGLDILPDNKSVLYFLTGGDKRRTLYLNHQPFHDAKSYVKVVAMRDLIRTNADGSHLAVVLQHPEHDCVVFDGKRGPEHPYHTVYVPTFSPDGKRFAYKVNKAGAYAIVIDGKVIPLTGQATHPAFSPDGEHIAYGVGGTGQIVLDGQPGPKFDNVGDPFFGPDSKSLAYYAEADKKKFIVFNGRQGPHFETIYSGNGLFISPDSKRIAYMIKLPDGKTSVVVDDTPGPPCDSASDLRFSPDSKRFVYTARFHEKDSYRIKESMVDNGIAGEQFDVIRSKFLAFSPDSATLTYVAILDDKYFVVVNGKKSDPITGSAGDPIFSPDGKRVVWNVNHKAPDQPRGYVVVNDEKGPDFDGVGAPEISPDSRHVAYVAAKEGKQFMVLDGKPHPDAGAIQTLNFSPDSRKLTYVTIVGRELWRKVMDVPEP